jgi:hypothetical protein
MTDVAAMQKYTLILPVAVDDCPDATALPDLNEHNSHVVDCWQCGGEGFIANCWEEWACLHPDEGCRDCRRKCNICRGKGGYRVPFGSEEP